MQASLSDYTAGAAAATDLVNTSPVVRGAGEHLADRDALSRFLAEHDLRLVRAPDESDLDQVHVLRQQVRTILEDTSEESAVAGANALVVRADAGPVVQRDPDGRWQWYVQTAQGASLADELAVLIGAGLLGVLRALSHDRFRHCASPACDGMFVDTSRAGRRRYCMPELCGNRMNVANHRARRRRDTAPESDHGV